MSRREVTVEMDHVPAKGRPRLTRSGRAYTPRRTRRDEAAVRAAWVEAHGTDPSWEPVELDVTVSHPLPKGSAKRRIGCVDLVRPDLDNVLKLVMDALNGVAWEDDTQVVALSARRLPKPAPGEPCRVRIAVEEMEER